MFVFLISISVLLALAGALMLSTATLIICMACLFAIYARIAQAK